VTYTWDVASAIPSIVLEPREHFEHTFLRGFSPRHDWRRVLRLASNPCALIVGGITRGTGGAHYAPRLPRSLNEKSRKGGQTAPTFALPLRPGHPLIGKHWATRQDLFPRIPFSGDLNVIGHLFGSAIARQSDRVPKRAVAQNGALRSTDRWVAHTLILMYAPVHHVMLDTPICRWIGCREDLAPYDAGRVLGRIHLRRYMRHPRYQSA
jgi:hypothetical protein